MVHVSSIIHIGCMYLHIHVMGASLDREDIHPLQVLADMGYIHYTHYPLIQRIWYPLKGPIYPLSPDPEDMRSFRGSNIPIIPYYGISPIRRGLAHMGNIPIYLTL